MIEAWLLKKLGSTWLSVVKWIIVILICAAPFIYHHFVVSDLTKRLNESNQNAQILEQNVATLNETVQNNQKYIAFIQENQRFINKLEAEYSKKAELARAKKAAFDEEIAKDKLVLGDKPITPLLAAALNKLNEHKVSDVEATKDSDGGSKNEQP